MKTRPCARANLCSGGPPRHAYLSSFNERFGRKERQAAPVVDSGLRHRVFRLRDASH